MVNSNRRTIYGISLYLEGAPQALLVGLPVETCSPVPDPSGVEPLTDCGFLPFGQVAKVIGQAVNSGWHGALISKRRTVNRHGKEVVQHKLQVLPRVPGDGARPWLSRKQLKKLLDDFSRRRAVGIRFVYDNPGGIQLVLTGRIPQGRLSFLSDEALSFDGVKVTLSLAEFAPPVSDLVVEALADTEVSTGMAAAFAAAM